MLNTINKKLLIIFALIMGLFTVTTLYLNTVTTSRSLQEVHQRLNKDFANALVEQWMEREGPRLTQGRIKHLFSTTLSANSNIDIYLLDDTGKILCSSDFSSMRRDRVSVEPIHQFLSPQPMFPVEGDDPQREGGQGLFSVAPIRKETETIGYLYVMLEKGGEGVTRLLDESPAGNLNLLFTLLAMSTFFLVGASLLTSSTRKISRLEQEIAAFEASGFTDPTLIKPGKDEPQDEIDRMQNIASSMAERISKQIKALKRSHAFGFELITNLSHDVRTPVSVIQGYSERMYNKEDISKEERRDYLRIVLNNLERLNRLLNELSSLVRFEKSLPLTTRRDVDINHELEDIVTTLAPEQQRRVHLNLISENMWIRGDEHAVRQSLKSIVANGLNNLSEDSTFEIRSERIEGELRFSFIDKGRYLDADSLDHYFDRFFRERGNPGRNPSGIEIALGKRILSAHGATVSADSSPESGTRVIISFPDFDLNRE